MHNKNIYDFKIDKKYKAISLWDTIEHITNPDLLMSNIKSLLEEKGYFFFSTPNTNSFEWKVMEKNHVQLLPPGHVNLYNSKNILNLLSKHKFEVVNILTLNPSLDITYIIKSIKEKEKSNLENFFLELISESDFKENFKDYLIKERMAGNMFVVARKL